MLGGQELALVLDSIGGPVVTALAHRLRFGGKVVSFGALSGQPTALDVRQDLIYRNISHHGFWTFNWLTRSPRAEIEAAYQEIVALVTSGELTADIDSTFRSSSTPPPCAEPRAIGATARSCSSSAIDILGASPASGG